MASTDAKVAVATRAPMPATTAAAAVIVVIVRKRRREREASDGASDAVASYQARRRRTSTAMSTQPTTAPAMVGIQARGVEPARVATAASDRAPARATPTTPNGGRIHCRMPQTAAATSTAIPSPASSAGLSASPNVVMANSFSGLGTMSMTKEPTAKSGLPCRAKTAASTSATARKAPALTTPASADHASQRTRIRWDMETSSAA